jgi:Amt family ammonium transporter
VFLLSALSLAAQSPALPPTNAATSDASLATPGATAQQSTLNSNGDGIPTALPVAPSAPDTNVPPTPPQLSAAPAPAPPAAPSNPGGWIAMGDLLVLAAVAGLVAYFCGLTQARHCGHTCTLLVAGLVFALLGFWAGGFAMEMGGMGDARAALAPSGAATGGALDHELGFYAGGRFWGLMGSAGFFLASDAETRDAVGGVFLGQAVLVALAVTAALGGALERARILALAIVAFLTGTLIFALPANWVWGGGWLAGLGRGGLGHGVVDLGGSGVIHLAAGVLALVLALELGPRYGRFGRRPAPVPGHNLPLAILGSLAVLLGLAAINAVSLPGASGAGTPSGDSPGALAAANTLLAAAGGLAASFVLVLYRTRRLDPAALCRGMLGGAVAISAGAAIEEAWAAVLTGAAAGLIVQATMRLLDRRQIDDPVGTVAVHGAGGAWGLVALGLFANGPLTGAVNGVSGPVRGLFTGHDGGQLGAQVIGVLIIGGIVFLLSYVCVSLTHKIVGIRVELADETAGLDEPKLGVLGYQADDELEKDE